MRQQSDADFRSLMRRMDVSVANEVDVAAALDPHHLGQRVTVIDAPELDPGIELGGEISFAEIGFFQQSSGMTPR